ncbi:hypothetical protein GCM10010300_76010 [Streptomyces olivaceoviridis]|nr:hypothetical protein GCM10010300_76010 [Streptomyces olivaceoviridis]
MVREPGGVRVRGTVEQAVTDLLAVVEQRRRVGPGSGRRREDTVDAFTWRSGDGTFRAVVKGLHCQLPLYRR